MTRLSIFYTEEDSNLFDSSYAVNDIYLLRYYCNILGSPGYTHYQVFIGIFLSKKNTGLRKIYEYIFSGKQAHSSEGTLGMVLVRSRHDWA
jgi:hypothetical protein